jgi:hypothetical protein
MRIKDLPETTTVDNLVDYMVVDRGLTPQTFRIKVGNLLATLTGGVINNTPIGNLVPSTGAFTTLSSSGLATLAHLSTSDATITGGSIDGTPIGATTPSTGNFTSVAVSSVAVPTISSVSILTNKTLALGSNTVSGTLAQFNTAVTDADLTSLAGVETLTNKTLTAPVVTDLAGTASNLSLSAISKSLHYGAVVKSIIYDTSKDSDGGAWRKRCSDKSWYTESLGFTGTWGGQAASNALGWAAVGSVTGGAYQSTADGKFYTPTSVSTQTEIFRGNVREFPEQVSIVAESARVVVYDLTQVGTPMWMVFTRSALNWLRSGGASSLSSVAASNGLLLAGMADSLVEINFISETGFFLAPSTYKSNGLISSRNAGLGFVSFSATAIVNSTVNDVALTVLDTAPIDPATGLPVPTIAVATAGGVSVIKDDGTVANYVTGAWSQIAWMNQSTLAGRRGSASNSNYATFELLSYPALSSTQITTPATLSTTLTTDVTNRSATNSLVVFNAGDKGASLLKHNPATPAKGMVSYITQAYNTGWMPGDIRLAALADTTAETITASGELVTNGDFPTATTGWSAPAASANVGGATLSIVSAKLRVTNDATGTNFGCAMQAITTVVGKTYVIYGEVTNGTANGALAVGNVGSGSGINNILANKPTGAYTFVAAATTTYVGFAATTSTASGTFDCDNISVKLADPDRSVKNTGLVLNGSLTKTAVASGAGLVAYSGFSASNYLEQPYSSQLDFGTGDFCVMGWCYVTAGDQPLVFRAVDASVTNPTNGINLWASSGTQIKSWINGTALNTAAGVTNASAWNFICVFRSGATVYIYTNGVLATSGANSGSITLANAKLQLGVGFYTNFSQQMALWRISATAPSADQIAHIYLTELPLFQANAKCTIDGTSTAVTALAYDDVADTLHVGTSWGRTAFRDLLRVDSEATTTGALTSLSANEGAVVTGGASSGRFYQPALLLRDELRRKDISRKALGKIPVPFDYTATASQTAFILPKGYTAKTFAKNGTFVREGTGTPNFVRSDDGFAETLTLSAGATVGDWVQIMAVRK